MGNMNYCMFQNTYSDLRDVWDDEDKFWTPEDLSSDERKARRNLIRLCNQVASEFPIDDEEDWA